HPLFFGATQIALRLGIDRAESTLDRRATMCGKHRISSRLDSPIRATELAANMRAIHVHCSAEWSAIRMLHDRFPRFHCVLLRTLFRHAYCIRCSNQSGAFGAALKMGKKP